MFEFQSSLSSDIGRRRSKNQDFGFASNELGLFIVADGMGGHRGGEIASQLAVKTIEEFVQQAKKINPPSTSQDVQQLMHSALKLANKNIYSQSEADERLRGMGTTVTCMLFHDQKAWIGHVGDSRCYFYRNESLWQLTRDHSLIEEKFRHGLITRDEMKTHGHKNIITRSVGFEASVEIDLFEFDVHPRDQFLLCSDGLTSHVKDPEILDLLDGLQKENQNPKNVTDELIRLANERAGDDNITALVVQVK